MNDLLFYILLIVLLYYFFYHLPNQKRQLSSIKLTQSQETQTPSTEDQSELEPILDQLIKSIQQLNRQIQ